MEKRKSLFGVIAVAAMLVSLLFSGCSPMGECLETYFNELYRVNGESYYLIKTDTKAPYELHRWSEAGNELVYRFPKKVQYMPQWSGSEQCFYYAQGSNLYRWDFDSGEEEMLFVIGSRYPVAVLDDYVILEKNQNENGKIWHVVPLEGEVFEKEIEVPQKWAYAVTVRQNQILFTGSKDGGGHVLYLYDASTEQLTLIRDVNGHVYGGVITEDRVYYSVDGQVYAYDKNEKEIVQFITPWTEGSVEAFAETEDGILFVRDQQKEKGREFVCYRIMKEKAVEEIYRWEAPLSASVVQGSGIAYGDGVAFAGYMTQEKLVEFPVK